METESDDICSINIDLIRKIKVNFSLNYLTKIERYFYKKRVLGLFFKNVINYVDFFFFSFGEKVGRGEKHSYIMLVIAALINYIHF